MTFQPVLSLNWRTGQPFAMPVASVMDYGSISADGVHDDAPGINNAIATASPGAVLYCPPGLYLCNSTINMKRGVSLVGSGSSVWSTAYLGFGNGVTRFVWGGASGATFFDFGNAWQGTFENLVVDGAFLAAKLLNCGAPQNSIFRNLVVRNTGFLINTGAIHLTTDGQKDPSNNQIISGSLNLFDSVMVLGTSGHCLWANGTLNGSNVVIGAITLNTFLNCNFDNTNPTGQVAVYLQQAADTNTFVGGRIVSGHNGTGVLINASTVNNAMGGVNFYGTAIEDGGDVTGTGIDARNNGWSNNLYGCFLPSSGTQIVLTNGVNPGKVKLFGCYQANIGGNIIGMFANISQPVVGASPWTYTNNFPYTIDLQLFNGTITSIQQKRNGVANNWNAGNTMDVATLEPGDALIVTYTGAPTAQVIPH